jgi:hypothetical protein
MLFVAIDVDKLLHHFNLVPTGSQSQQTTRMVNAPHEATTYPASHIDMPFVGNAITKIKPLAV